MPAFIIMVAEDNYIKRKQIKKKLEGKFNFNSTANILEITLDNIRCLDFQNELYVALCPDGEVAIQFFRTYHDQIRLVILDYQMPFKNGDQVLAGIIATLQLKEIDKGPAIILNSAQDEYNNKMAKAIPGTIQLPHVKGPITDNLDSILATLKSHGLVIPRNLQRRNSSSSSTSQSAFFLPSPLASTSPPSSQSMRKQHEDRKKNAPS